MLEPKPVPPSGTARRKRIRRTPPGFYSIAELAAVASAPRSTLYFKIRNRELPAHRWRNRIVVPETAVAELLAVRPLDDDAPVYDACAASTDGADHE